LEALEKKKDLCKRLGSHGIYSKNEYKRDPEKERF
jgi:hypothetical protein